MSERIPYATIADIESLFRLLSEDEKTRAKALLLVVSDSLRQEALKVGKDLDEMLVSGQVYDTVVKSVVVDVVSRTLLTSTSNEPMTQYSQSALGYSVSGTYLVPGGGLFIKKAELNKLGLRRQQIGGIDFYDNKGNHNPVAD